MIGVALEDGIDAAALGADLLTRGLVVNVPAPGTLRLLPPLVVEADQVDRGGWTDRRIASKLVRRTEPRQRSRKLDRGRLAELVRSGSAVDRRRRRGGRGSASVDSMTPRRRRAAAPTRRAPRAKAIGGAEALGAASRRSILSSPVSPACGSAARQPSRVESRRGRSAAEPEPDPAELEPAASAPAGARLLATQMAVSGSSRDEIEARLRNGFAIADPHAILDAILGPEN